MKAKPTEKTATYVFCLLRAGKAPSAARAPATLPGMGKARVVDAGGGLYLAVADAPLERYGEIEIERGLQDLDWVSACALAHEQVVEHFARAEAIVPLKLFTLFLDERRAIAFVEKARRSLNATLDRIEGCLEYGVRISYDEARALEATRAQLGGRPAGGADFLRAKKQLRDSVRELSTRAHPKVDTAFEALADAAKDARRRSIATHGGGKRLMLDGAYLVPLKKGAAFKQQVESLQQAMAAEGYEVTLTGPWPPYNFIQEAA